ncbi:MAG TPA: hypothetical protein VIL26_04455 [Clostridia bacterium]
MLEVVKKVKVNFALLAFLAYTVKMLVIAPTFPEVGIFFAIAAVYAFKMKLQLLEPKDLNKNKIEAEKMKAEIQELKKEISKLSIGKVAKPQKYF